MTTQPRRGGQRFAMVVGAALTLALVVLAFTVLDVVIAAAVAIVLVTGLGITIAASGWDQHSTYEERELERARRRQQKWAQNEDARARDRARWQAHQARRTGAPDGER